MTVGVFREFFYNERLNFKNLSSDTIVIFDTNTLLNIYRYSNDTRNELIAAINSIQGNIWMPYQVGLEFNLNRRNVISNLNKEKTKRNSEIENSLTDSIKSLKQSVRAVSLKSTDANNRKKEIIKFLEEKTTDFKNELQKKINEIYEMLDLSEDLASEIAKIFDGRIGDCYTQNQLDTKLADAKERYDNKIPPGYKDANKIEVTNYNGVQFEKKYGDLIVWHQILDKASEEKIKKVVLVTDDNKEDWWYESSGETIGPRAELKNEMLRVANADLYMLNANSFLNNFASNEDVKDLISTDVFKLDKEESNNTPKWIDFIIENNPLFKPVNKTNMKKESTTSFVEPKKDSDLFKLFMLNIGELNTQIANLEVRSENLGKKISIISNDMKSMNADDYNDAELFLNDLIRENIEIFLQINTLKSKKAGLMKEWEKWEELKSEGII